MILYSINTWLAYKIAEHFYSNNHYVWCSPIYNCKNINPPSSDPFEICTGLLKDVEGNDKHSAKIAMNKTGIIKGADIKLSQGVINNDQRLDILDVIEQSEIEHFRPLIFVIPHDGVKTIIKQASTKLTAGLFSKEFIIEELPRNKFDIIDIYKNEKHL